MPAEPANWERELFHRSHGAKVIAGIDEVGRGAWAGPLVAVAYIFHAIPAEISVYDSKSLTDRRRHDLAASLLAIGDAGYGLATASEIDAIGLQAAQYTAYERAITSLPMQPSLILLDGRPWHACPTEHEAIVGGDRLVASIAAASILAKVYRDDLMRRLVHRQLPNYGFNRHVGYGTAEHRQVLAACGPSTVHRRSFGPVGRS